MAQSQLRLPARPFGLRLALAWCLGVYTIVPCTLCSASSTEQLKHTGSVCRSNSLHLSHPSSHSKGKKSRNTPTRLTQTNSVWQHMLCSCINKLTLLLLLVPSITSHVPRQPNPSADRQIRYCRADLKLFILLAAVECNKIMKLLKNEKTTKQLQSWNCLPKKWRSLTKQQKKPTGFKQQLPQLMKRILYYSICNTLFGEPNKTAGGSCQYTISNNRSGQDPSNNEVPPHRVDMFQKSTVRSHKY